MGKQHPLQGESEIFLVCQVQRRHKVHGRKEALHFLADHMEIHQSSDCFGYFSFLPGDTSSENAHLFGLGPRVCKEQIPRFSPDAEPV